MVPASHYLLDCSGTIFLYQFIFKTLLSKCYPHMAPECKVSEARYIE
jgi:hypothetical protein